MGARPVTEHIIDSRGGQRQGKAAPAPGPQVVGLDLSLTATGMTLPDGQPMTISPGKGLHGVARLEQIRAAVFSAFAPRGTALVVVEGPAYSRALGAGHHEASGLWWLIAYELTARGIPYAIVSPTALKKYATGRGNATKPDLRMALYQRAGLDLRDDNQVDAWWLRSMGLDHLGHAPVSLPAAHRAVLGKVAWPEVGR